MSARYDAIGEGYASRRVEDPTLAARIAAALGDARTICNVGAGTGNYEPRDRTVLAVEPSEVMNAQRPADRPAIRGSADALPLFDASVDACMTVLSLHHWHPHAARGVAEMCRVARDTVVIATIDPRVCGRMWLLRDYLHEVREMDDRIFPVPEVLVGWLDRPARIEVVPVRRDTPDASLMSFWAHPERVLDPVARAATSGFARQPADVVERVVAAVREDLASGAWDARNGELRALESYDAGLRLVVARRDQGESATSRS